MRQNISYVILDEFTKAVTGRCSLLCFKVAYGLQHFLIAYFTKASRRSVGYATEATHMLALMTLEFLKAKN